MYCIQSIPPNIHIRLKVLVTPLKINPGYRDREREEREKGRERREVIEGEEKRREGGREV